MSQITITDEVVLAELRRGDTTITVRDGDGNICGVITPLRPSDLQPRISDDELRKREGDTNCKLYTTEEVIAKLRAL